MSDRWQLVAHPEGDICDIAVLSVQRAFKQQKPIARIVDVANIAAAWESVASNGLANLDMVVIASTMPADDSASVGLSDRNATRQFVKQLKRDDPLLPVIVVANTPDEPLADFLDAFYSTGLVRVGPTLGPTLVERITALRASAAASRTATTEPAARRADSWIELDIHLGGNQSGCWQISRVGADVFKANGPFHVDPTKLRRFIRDSKQLDDDVARNDEKWFDALKDLSTDLRALLFRNGDDNIDFWNKFVKHRERVGGVARSRICVTVDEDTHSMLLEALRDSEDSEDEFWALTAPVFRRYTQPMALPPLFKDRDAASRDEPINCLVIDADPEPGVVVWSADVSESFSRLKHLVDEANRVEALLRGQPGCHVERLSLAALDGDLRDHVIGKLRERQWHLVHFCGHVSGQAKGAGLVLRADAAGVLPVTTLAGALERTQLLFLSSCRSASTRIVMNAVEQHVAAVVGFQWVIDDRAASEFAVDFYQQLFNREDEHGRSLEYAMLEARRKVYQRHGEQPSWVAPVLVMQMD